MGKIWSYEVLSALCRHKKPIVREWAINRLSLLYPEEAGDVAIKLISDEDGIVAKKAVDHFLNHPTGKYKDDLLNLYKKSSGRITGRIANVLSTLDDVRLIDAFKDKFASTAKTDLIGYPLTVVNIAMLHADESKKIAEESLKNIFNEDYDASIAGTLFMANLIAGTDIETLLNFCYRHPDNLDLVIVLLTEIDGHCGSWYSAEDLEEKGKKGLLKYEPPHMVQESLDYIEAQRYKDTRERLEKLFRKGKYEDLTGEIFGETSAIIEAGEKHIGEDAFNRWQNGNGKPRRNIRALAAFKDKITSAPGEFREPIARIAISLFARVIEYKGLIGLDLAKADTDGILGVFLQERGSVEDDDKIEEILANADDREKVLTACLRHIEERPESWANLRIVRLIGKAGNISDFARLLETDADHTGLWDEIVQAIERFGTSAVDIVKPIFERFDESKISYALQILGNIPVAASTDIIIKHWDRLWTTDKEGLLEAVRGIGDRRFIEPLKKELREGERYEAEIFHLLCLINNIIDPQFKKAEKEIDKHKQKVSERLDALKSSDINKLLKEPLKIELKCRSCYRAYHYDVEKITITEDSRDKFIIDKIKCKNCGVVDHYEITPAGEMAVTSHLMLLVMGGKKVVKESPFIKGKSLPIYGKQMSMNETVTFYENKIKDHPKNPEYLLGYANTLRKAKRTEDAVPVYENTAALDPLAVEAYVSLGDIAKDKCDYKSSYEYFKKAGGLLHTGNYYKVTQDLDQFKEAVLDNLAYIGDRLGVKPFTQPLVKGESGRVNDGMKESIVKYPQAGRNAPCPCGSGKKYKKCCLQKEVGPKSSVEDRIRSVEKALTDRVISYSRKFHEDFLNAIAIYWRTEPIEPLVLPERALEDKGSFTEWFVIDYLLPSGKTVLEEFYSEMFHKLTDEEKKMLESHMTSCMNIYEILDVREGSGLGLKELFTGSEMDVVEIKGSQKLVKWDIIMVRIYSLNGINRILSPIVQVIPRTLKDRLTSYLSEQFERFKQETGITEWQAFMKKRSYIIRHYIEDLPEEKKILLTEERHKIVLAKALFDAKESEDILDLLENEYDFVVDKVVKGKEAQLTWLKRGKSKELQESEQKHQHGLVMQSKLIHESGQMEWTVVGNIIVTPGKMTLECMSKERLQRGKQRLQEILGGLIKHKFDTFEDIEKRLERSDHKETKDKPELSDKSRLIMEASMMRFFKGWLDDKVPSLDGMSPREAVKTPAGKQKVLELIKDFENTEERKRKDGEPYFDIGILKKEFGLD